MIQRQASLSSQASHQAEIEKSECERSASLATQSAAAPAPAPEEKVVELGSRSFTSEGELRKHFKTCNWRVRASTDTRIYYECKLELCNVTFNANKISDADGETWSISKMPTCHSCGSTSKTTKVETSLVTLKDNLSVAICEEIERLGSSGAFTSKQIQTHLLQAKPPVLVDTRLIHNIAYRFRQKLFGHKGDLINLLEQQKVALIACVHKKCCNS